MLDAPAMPEGDADDGGGQAAAAAAAGLWAALALNPGVTSLTIR